MSYEESTALTKEGNLEGQSVLQMGRKVALRIQPFPFVTTPSSAKRDGDDADDFEPTLPDDDEIEES